MMLRLLWTGYVSNGGVLETLEKGRSLIPWITEQPLNISRVHHEEFNTHINKTTDNLPNEHLYMICRKGVRRETIKISLALGGICGGPWSATFWRDASPWVSVLGKRWENSWENFKCYFSKHLFDSFFDDGIRLSEIFFLKDANPSRQIYGFMKTETLLNPWISEALWKKMSQRRNFHHYLFLFNQVYL